MFVKVCKQQKASIRPGFAGVREVASSWLAGLQLRLLVLNSRGKCAVRTGIPAFRFVRAMSGMCAFAVLVAAVGYFLAAGVRWVGTHYGTENLESLRWSTLWELTTTVTALIGYIVFSVLYKKSGTGSRGSNAVKR